MEWKFPFLEISDNKNSKKIPKKENLMVTNVTNFPNKEILIVTDVTEFPNKEIF